MLIGETDNIYNAFSRLVEDHFDKGMSLKSYADQLNITEKTLTRIVKRHTDNTPAQLIKERVLLEACRLLKVSDLPVKGNCLSPAVQRFGTLHKGIPA